MAKYAETYSLEYEYSALYILYDCLEYKIYL